MVSASQFDAERFYSSYSKEVIARPGYPPRAVWKAVLAWQYLGSSLLSLTDDLNRVADVGGCYGFGLNAFLFHGSRIVSHPLRGDLYELDGRYVELGQQLFPHLQFRHEDFSTSNLQEPYDVTLLFDILEHLVDPRSFLASARERTRFIAIRTPFETSYLRERLMNFGRTSIRPVGEAHPEGHLHFFKMPTFMELLSEQFVPCRVVVVPWNSMDPVELLNTEQVSSSRIVRRPSGLWRLARHTYRTLTEGVRVKAVRSGLIEGSAFILARAR